MLDQFDRLRKRNAFLEQYILWDGDAGGKKVEATAASSAPASTAKSKLNLFAQTS
jgi:hypothetical protein